MASSHHFTQPRQVSGRLAPPVMLCCSAAPASSSTPLRPSVHYPSISLVVKLMFIQTFCDHLNVIIFSIRQTCIVLKSGWSSTARMRASSLVLLPSLPLTPRRHRQADKQLSSLYPPLAKFRLVWRRLCEALLSSCLARQKHPHPLSLSMSDICRRYNVVLP